MFLRRFPSTALPRSLPRSATLFSSPPFLSPRIDRINSISLRHSSSLPPPPPSLLRKALLPSVLLLTLSISYYYFSPPPIAQLSQTGFVPLTLVRREELSSDTTLYGFNVPNEIIPEEVRGGMEGVEGRGLSSVYVYQPELSIQRPYTILSNSFLFSEIEGKGGKEMELVVKRYEDGEVSRWLFRLPIGTNVLFKGPVSTKLLSPNLDSLVFIVGGTGITPAFQFLDSLLYNPQLPTSTKKVQIIYSSTSPQSILLKDRLDSMKTELIEKGIEIEIKYLISSDPSALVKPKSWYSFGKAVGGEKREDELLLTRIDEKNLLNWIGKNDVGDLSSGNKKIIVCGPDSLVKAVAGPLARNQAQGPLGGILKELGYTAEMVIKL